MKKNSLLFLAMMGLFSLTWTGCTDEVDYTPAEAVEGQGVYFDKSVETSYTLKDVKGEITLNLGRTNTSGSFDAPLTVSINEGGDKLFKVPSTVPFAAGEASSSIKITFDNLVRGTNYEVSLSLADATAYGHSSVKLNVIYPKEVEYQWEVVSENAVLIDNLFQMYGAKDVSLLQLTEKPMVVEKAKGFNMFRFRSPYTNEYFQALFEMDVFPADYEYPYIVLDGETNKEHGLWYIKSTNLGFQMVDGEGPKFDPEWNTFGSIAGNLQTADGPIPPTSKDFPLGTFDKKSQKFDFGVTYHNLGGYGYFINKASFSLFLDARLMEPDFLRDYTWEPVENSKGQFTSEICDGQVSMLPVYKAKEDETFYCLPQVYSEEGFIFFNIKDGVVTLPKKQKTGLDTYGNPIYMEGTPGKSSFNEETKLLTLGITFYMGDEEGNKIADLKSGSEQFMWGYTEVDLLKKNKAISDYAGNWKVKMFHVEEGLKGEAPVTVSVSGDNTLSVKGLSAAKGLDDTFTLDYNSESGLLSFKSQQTADHPAGLPVFITLYNSVTVDAEFLHGTNDEFIGGFVDDNTLTFYNNPENKVRWDGMSFFAIQDGSPLFVTGLYNSLNWAKATVEKTQAMMSNCTFSKAPAAQSDKEYKFSLNKNFSSDMNFSDNTKAEVSLKTNSKPSKVVM